MVTRTPLHISVDEPDTHPHAGYGQFLNYSRDSYLERTSRPVYAIVFLLPFIVFYEIGTLLINTDLLSQSQVRVVAFVWLQDLLSYLGYEGRLAWIAPPLVVIVILLGLQITSRKPWYFLITDVGPMVGECILLAIPLIVLSLFINSSAAGPPGEESSFAQLSVSLVQAAGGAGTAPGLLADIITGVGAGIYEELVFRLILISILVLLLQDLLGFSQHLAVVLAVMISAALFSAHHHIVFVNGGFSQASAFNWTEFGFRTLAGIYFAVLFALRGFGITAGTHAFYDIIATCLNAVFFPA